MIIKLNEHQPQIEKSSDTSSQRKIQAYNMYEQEDSIFGRMDYMVDFESQIIQLIQMGKLGYSDVEGYGEIDDDVSGVSPSLNDEREEYYMNQL